MVSTDLLRCSDAVARHGVSPVRSGLQGCTGLGGLLPSRCGGDDRQAWSDDRRAVLTNGGFGPLLLKGNDMKPEYKIVTYSYYLQRVYYAYKYDDAKVLYDDFVVERSYAELWQGNRLLFQYDAQSQLLA